MIATFVFQKEKNVLSTAAGHIAYGHLKEDLFRSNARTRSRRKPSCLKPFLGNQRDGSWRAPISNTYFESIRSVELALVVSLFISFRLYCVLLRAIDLETIEYPFPY